MTGHSPVLEAGVFQGQSLRVVALPEPGVFEIVFDRVGESINKFDDRTVGELREAVDALRRQPHLRGVLATSAKDVFIVGADITEFGRKFSQTAQQISADVVRSNEVFVAFEDLPVPSVVAVNGFALGGGLEFVLSCSLRVLSSQANVGVPEVKLGLFPGFGGTVRLSRLVGLKAACDWVASGRPAGAEAALAVGVADAVAAPEALRATALDWLSRAMAGDVDWAARQAVKRGPVPVERRLTDAALKDLVAQVRRASPPHQPAAEVAVTMMARAAALPRAEALALEASTFGDVARTQAAAALVQAFLDDQSIKKSVKALAQGAPTISKAAVIGAGIMGGGMAITAALRGVSVQMKDIQPQALELGLGEAQRQVARQQRLGRLDDASAAAVLALIQPQLDDAGLDQVDIVVEAIVENLGTKRRVLGELESTLAAHTVIASNTSSLRIDDIAAGLAHPERLVGMHFFNPVPMMPLVEIVRGSRSSDGAVARAVGLAVSMGKTPIVVKDCPGFLVNRLLTAYMRGFLHLVADGADFTEVDRVMEAFGWPMGPAHLEDVVGIDTGSHVNDVISAGYPERMPALADDALKRMASLGRLGQKSGVGFYRYERRADGKPARSLDPQAHDLLAALQPGGRRTFSDAEIVDRMMLPMVIEAAQALEDGVVRSALELDRAMLLGLGFPAYAGGPLQYADWLGLREVLSRCDRLRPLGPAYEPTPRMRAMAATGGRFRSAT